MANNRLWAVCKDDNKSACLIKYYPGPGGWGGEFNNKNEFFDEHENCPSNHGCGENITFVTETEHDRVELYDFTNFNDIRIILKKEEKEENSPHEKDL